jgi:Carbohydrate family 9 binding domain-like
VINQTQIVEAPHIAFDFGVGDLNNAAWARAKSALLNLYWSGQPAPAGRHAEARLLWSDKALHVRFVCHQTEPLIVSPNPQTAKKTLGLWDRDVCEVFIAPDTNSVERYYEFEAAPTGEWMDVAIQRAQGKRQADWEFSSQMSTAAQVEKDRVTIAMRIPWNQSIHKPERNERWRVNLFRCVGKDPNRGYLAWQPTRTPQPNFHVPEVFGWLIFA